jgi:hypothetical protein
MWRGGRTHLQELVDNDQEMTLLAGVCSSPLSARRRVPNLK